MLNTIEFDKLCYSIHHNYNELISNQEMLKDTWLKAGQLNVFETGIREDSIKVLEIMSKHCVFDFPFWLQKDVLLPMFEKYASDYHKRLYLGRIKRGELICALAITEESGGSSFENITSIAVKHGDNFVLSCKKNIVTNALIADLFFLITKEESGRLCSFILDKSKHDFSVTPFNTIPHISGFQIGILECNNLNLELSDIFCTSDSTHFCLLSFLPIERFCCSTIALKICRKIYKDAIVWLRNRDPKHKYSSVWNEMSCFYTELLQCELIEKDINEKYKGKRNLFYYSAVYKFTAINLLLKMSSSIARISGCNSIDMYSSLDTEKYIHLAYAYSAAGGTQEVMSNIIERYISRYI